MIVLTVVLGVMMATVGVVMTVRLIKNPAPDKRRDQVGMIAGVVAVCAIMAGIALAVSPWIQM